MLQSSISLPTSQRFLVHDSYKFNIGLKRLVLAVTCLNFLGRIILSHEYHSAELTTFITRYHRLQYLKLTRKISKSTHIVPWLIDWRNTPNVWFATQASSTLLGKGIECALNQPHTLSQVWGIFSKTLTPREDPLSADPIFSGCV
jgi:hypothetical protein